MVPYIGSPNTSTQKYKPIIKIEKEYAEKHIFIKSSEINAPPQVFLSLNEANGHEL